MWARREIRVRFNGRKLGDTSSYAHLAVHLSPVKYQSRMPIRRQLLSLAAFVVGEEQEAALIDSFE